MQREIKFLPCPFCGDEYTYGAIFRNNKWVIRCNGCKAQTRMSHGLEQAKERWNKRHKIEDLK